MMSFHNTQNRDSLHQEVMQEGISLQQVLPYLSETIPIILAGIIFANSSIFREGNKIKIASELNMFSEFTDTAQNMNECALPILCHETGKIKSLPLAMLILNSAVSHVELSDSTEFYSCPHFFSRINVNNTYSALVYSSKCSRNICMTLRPGVFTQQPKEHYNNTQFFYHALPRALQRPPISVL